MSWGHMTKQERAITFGGMAALATCLMLYGEYNSKLALIAVVPVVIGTFALKRWAWKHTEYPDGWSSAQWTWDNE